MKMPSLIARAALPVALLISVWSGPAAALERQPARAASLPASTAEGRVVVKFRDDSGWRKQILAASRGDGDRVSTATSVQHLLQQRADALGQRHGLALQALGAVDERSQVVRARGVDSVRLAAALAADPQVEWAVPDGRRRALRVPNDPLYGPSPAPSSGPASGQWYLKPPAGTSLVTGDEVLAGINAQGAWDITTGHSSVIVAVLDTGIRPEHPDLQGKVVSGYDLVDPEISNDGNGPDPDASDPGDWVSASEAGQAPYNDCDEADSSWHGTKVAGLIAAATHNAVGMAGAGWNVRVQPVRVLGKCFGYDSDIVKGMRWAAGLSVPGLPANANPSKVINLSLGGEGACTAVYSQAINEVLARNVVVVAAAGNTTGRAVSVPANCPGVIGVAALRHIGTKVGFSDVGPEISIAAPGGNCVNVGASDPCLYPLLSTTNTGTTRPAGSSYTNAFDISVGTSFSSPLVAATAALMVTANRSLTPAGVTAAMKATARAFPQSGAPADPDTGAIPVCHAPNGTDQLQCYCTTSTCGAGMLDAYRAVRSVARLEAYVGAVPSSAAGQPLTLQATPVLPEGRTVASYQWTLVAGNGVVASLDGVPTDQSTLTVTPATNGSFVVRLTVTDDSGATSTSEQAVTVGGSSTPTPPPAPPSDDGGGGGGAMSAWWLAALALAVAVSRPRRRRA